MERTVLDGHLQAVHRETCQHTITHSFTETLFNGRNIFTRNIAAFYFINKYQSCLSLFSRSQFKCNISKFTTTTGLLLENLAMLNNCGKSFFIGHLRRTLVAFNTKFPFKPVHQNFKMKLTHTAYYGLT